MRQCRFRSRNLRLVLITPARIQLVQFPHVEPPTAATFDLHKANCALPLRLRQPTFLRRTAFRFDPSQLHFRMRQRCFRDRNLRLVRSRQPGSTSSSPHVEIPTAATFRHVGHLGGAEVHDRRRRPRSLRRRKTDATIVGEPTTKGLDATTFRPYVPDQSLLLPPDVREWLPEPLAHHVSDLVDGLDRRRSTLCTRGTAVATPV